MYRYEATVGTTIPDVQDNYTIGLFEKALANPNATRTVAFNPFAPVQDLVNTSSPLYQNWNLQINISDFSAPNAQAIVQNETDFTWSETTLVDPHVIDYSYGFSWPSTGDSSLESALPENVTDVCFATLALWATPANVSNLLLRDDAADSGDCAAALGTACVDAIAASLASDDLSDCSSVETPWASLPACADTLGWAASQAYNPDYGSLYARSLSQYNNQSGASVWGGWTGARNGSDAAPYEALAAGLQVMAVAPVVGNVSRAQVLCTRINADRMEDDDEEDGGDVSAGWLLRADSGIAALVVLGWTLAAVYAA
ncbi:hypothetical protein KJ359_001307 [Pestalotiopsis sp. 9143b]|nr:hypothetical protein KJ359_001307 [Pestalotiopsis sp. 9143b]